MCNLVDYLSRPESIETEGIFRKTGNVSRQRLLKELVLGGTGDFHLDDKTFSPHDVATVLKQILSELSDPLLTHKHYEAHIKIADMSKLCLSEREKKHTLEKQVKSFQLLILMLPRENAAFLETLFKLLSRTARCPENKMAATSLGVVFAHSLICPRKLSAEGLQSVSGTLSKVVTLIIENMESIFKVPCEIVADVANFWQEMENPSMELLTAQACNEKDRTNIQKAKEYTCVQDTKTALAQLIARVQSAKKLLKPLNRATNVQCSTKKGKHMRSRSFGESLKVVRLRDTMPEKLTTFCNAHLSILLEMDDNKLDKIVRKPVTDLNANKKKATTLFSKKKDYLSRPEFIETEGIFRKTGNVSRQRLLKELVLGGTGDFHLDDKTFSPHDVATVLKQILSELPDPLLTHKHYESHIKIADMSKLCLTAREKKHALEKQVKSLQLLMLMLPRENAAFLETLFKLLSRTTRCPENKMAATSLGVVFAPSLICPRKLSAEGLQSVSGTLSKVVTLMIENMESIFKVPCEIAADNGSSSAMKTVNTFAERKSPEEYTFVEETQTALAQPIARVQPAKKLLKQLNRATNVQCNTKKGKHSRSRSFGESLKVGI
ncbi:RHG19-like protein [Mya arenaria]|uniref:RHG19-like protein n=1 Tax=Mya arenaria TaxID=6604 RepID=A0ABY7FE69_MYAAR|nr:RHG19-like protein [Mya arenaria]